MIVIDVLIQTYNESAYLKYNSCIYSYYLQCYNDILTYIFYELLSVLEYF